MGSEVQVVITKVDGGFIVQGPWGTKVTASLQKAIGFVREALKGDEVESD